MEGSRNHRFFGYINGRLPNVTGLNETSLKLSGQKDDEEPRVFVNKFSDWPQIIIRTDHEWVYGHELKPGWNKIIADYMLLSMFVETGNWTFTAEATLPDGRVLFCFEASMYLEGEA